MGAPGHDSRPAWNSKSNKRFVNKKAKLSLGKSQKTKPLPQRTRSITEERHRESCISRLGAGAQWDGEQLSFAGRTGRSLNDGNENECA